MVTLQNVHDGRDLLTCCLFAFGYEQDRCKGVAVKNDGVAGIRDDVGMFLDLCVALSPTLVRDDAARKAFAGAWRGAWSEDVSVQHAALVAATGVRRKLRDLINGGLSDSDLKDVLYLDLSLEGHVRMLLESTFLPRANSSAHAVPDAELLSVPLLTLENILLSEGGGIGVDPGSLAEVYSRFASARHAVVDGGGQGAYVEAVNAVNAANGLLGDLSAKAHGSLQPSADAVASALGVDGELARRVSEDAIRMGLPPTLGQYLTAIRSALKDRAMSA